MDHQISAALLFVVVGPEMFEEARLRFWWQVVGAEVKTKGGIGSSVRPATFLGRRRILGQPVAAAVIFVPRVASGPQPGCVVERGQFVQFHPEVDVAHRLMLSPPLPPLPFDDPLCDPIKDVLGIGRDLDLAGFPEGEQALDRRHQLHPVVRGVRIEPKELLLDASKPENASPSTRPGIAETRAVRDERDLLHASELPFVAGRLSSI